MEGERMNRRKGGNEERKGGKEMEGQRREKGSKGKVIQLLKTQTLTNDGCSTTPV